MFNTGLNHFLQSFDSSVIYWILYVVSMLGTTYFIMFFIFSIIAGVDFRKGIVIANIFGWTILITVVLKNYIDYPRPLAIDSTLNSFGEPKVNADLSETQPSRFFELFSQDLLSKTRENSIARTGFPSGHVTAQIAVWLSLALLMRKRWLWFFSISFIALTMISRLYLAQHFLGDVLGGLLIGLIVVGILMLIIKKIHIIENTPIRFGQVFLLLSPLILIPFYKYLPVFQVGSFVGLNLAFLFLIRKYGSSISIASGWKRMANVVNFFLVFVLFSMSSKLIPLNNGNIFALFYFTLTGFLAILISSFIARYFNMMIFSDHISKDL